MLEPKLEARLLQEQKTLITATLNLPESERFALGPEGGRFTAHPYGEKNAVVVDFPAGAADQPLGRVGVGREQVPRPGEGARDRLVPRDDERDDLVAHLAGLAPTVPIVDDFWEAPPPALPSFATAAFDVETVAADRTRPADGGGCTQQTRGATMPFYQRGDVRIHYREEGTGPALMRRASLRKAGCMV